MMGEKKQESSPNIFETKRLNKSPSPSRPILGKKRGAKDIEGFDEGKSTSGAPQH